MLIKKEPTLNLKIREMLKDPEFQVWIALTLKITKTFRSEIRRAIRYGQKIDPDKNKRRKSTRKQSHGKS